VPLPEEAPPFNEVDPLSIPNDYITKCYRHNGISVNGKGLRIFDAFARASWEAAYVFFGYPGMS
jgi:hypothetical protein